MSSRNKEVIAKVNDAFARGDVEGFLSYCAEDFVWTMVGHERFNGKAAVREWMGRGPADPPQFTVDTLVAEGDHVCVVGNMTMDEKGEAVPYAYCDVWRFRGSEIAELKVFITKTGPAAA